MVSRANIRMVKAVSYTHLYGNLVPFSPKHKGTLGVDYKPGNWTFNLNSDFQSSQFADNANTVKESADGLSLIHIYNLPSFGVSILVPLIPAIIMISTTIANIWLVKDTPAWEVVNFIGSSPIAMFIAMVVAFVLFGTARAVSYTHLIYFNSSNFSGKKLDH